MSYNEKYKLDEILTKSELKKSNIEVSLILFFGIAIICLMVYFQIQFGMWEGIL